MLCKEREKRRERSKDDRPREGVNMVDFRLKEGRGLYVFGDSDFKLLLHTFVNAFLILSTYI